MTSLELKHDKKCLLCPDNTYNITNWILSTETLDFLKQIIIPKSINYMFIMSFLFVSMDDKALPSLPFSNNGFLH